MAEAPRPLKVITSGAQAAPVEALLADYPGRVELSFGSSLGRAHDSIPTRVSEGQRFDVYLLAEGGHAQLARDGVLSGPFVPIVESRIGAAVAEGAPRPDISTTGALRRALLGANSVAHAASASGIYLSTVVFPALGIADAMKDKARTIYSERVGRVVTRGEAELGFQQMSELIPIPGLSILGSLPPEFDRTFVFGASLGSDAEMRSAADDFLAFLRSDKASAEFARWGLDPIHPGPPGRP
ncbi:solute-binding protein [Rhodobacterales bacterium HKCCSP123]|nr:solute-binding protein [Rhodobacterales bacterium HKCCSP123]